MLVCVSGPLGEARPRRSSCAQRRGARLACATRLKPGQGVMADVNILGWRCEEAARLLHAARACVDRRAVWVKLAERLTACSFEARLLAETAG